MERIKEALAKARNSSDGQAAGRPDIAPARARESLLAPVAGKRPFADVRRVTLNRSHLENNRIVTLDKADPHCSHFDILRTRVLQAMTENGWQTLAITSPDAECGKTVTSANLALSMAQQPERTCILVDFDLRRPNVGKTLGLSMERSLADYLYGMAEVGDVIVNPELDGFYVLPNHPAVQNASEMLSSKPTAELIGELRSRYPEAIIVFDLPPLLAYDDVNAFLPNVDCVLMVAAVHKTKVPDIDECERRLSASNYLGLVLNKVDETFNRSEAYRY